MTKARDGTKKATGARSPASRNAKPAGGKSPAAKPARAASKAPAKAPAKSPAKSSAKPAAKAAAKAAAKSAGKAAAKPVAKAPAKPVAKPAAGLPAKASAKAPAKTAAKPAPVVPARPVKKVEAPKPFQREYKKWVERLISLRHQLLAEGERLGEEGLKALEQEVSVDHMADFGSDSYEQDTTLSLIENKSEALRDVDEALRRIETRTYGLCEECEQMIPAGRLEVLPHARYCVACQAAREGTV